MTLFELNAANAADYLRAHHGIEATSIEELGGGVSNVVLGWPILAALCHSAGAAALVGVLTSLLMRMVLGGRRPASSPVPDAVPAGHAAAAAVSR